MKCLTCNCNISPASGTKDIDRHVKTAKHATITKSARNQWSLFNVGVTSTAISEEESKFQADVFQSELLLATHVAKSNAAFAESTNLIR